MKETNYIRLLVEYDNKLEKEWKKLVKKETKNMEKKLLEDGFFIRVQGDTIAILKGNRSILHEYQCDDRFHNPKIVYQTTMIHGTQIIDPLDKRFERICQNELLDLYFFHHDISKFRQLTGIHEPENEKAKKLMK